MRPPLSEGEQRVLRLVAEGLSNDAIARRLCLSTSTVKSHLARVYQKWRVTNRVEACLLLWEPRPEAAPEPGTPEEALRLLDALAAALADDDLCREVRRRLWREPRAWHASRRLARRLAQMRPE